MKLIGVDFTSAPCRRKAITVAHGSIHDKALLVSAITRHTDFASFEALLAAPGPWLGAFDFPFGLPREGVIDLGWPQEWDALVRHCSAIGKIQFKTALDAYRVQRPFGMRYPHRKTDIPARSHSPFKLVNPPVGLMFLAGAPRLLAANVCIPGIRHGDNQRIAVEAYPALVARRYSIASYKSDDRRRQTAARAQIRTHIVERIERDTGLRFEGNIRQQALEDPSGDTLDAILALTQATNALHARKQGFGLPQSIDPIEGWIVGA